MRAPTVWADVIGAASDGFKNATVDILDPSLVTSTFEVATNSYTTVGNPVVASDIPARVQPVRLAVDQRAGATGNPSGEVRMRVQIPRDSFSGKIKRGYQIRVTEATRNPELENYLIVVDAEVNSSWRASITVEGMVNVENESLPTTPTAITGSVTDGTDPVGGVVVRAFREEDGIWLWELAATTDANGSYVLAGTNPTYTYAIVAKKTGYVTEYYDGAVDFAGATLVAHNATGVDFELALVP